MESISAMKFLVDTSIKALAVMGMAGIASLFLYRSSASTRSLVWAFTLTALVLLPVVSAMAPAWEVPLLPDVFTSGTDFLSRFYESAGESSSAAAIGDSAVPPEMDGSLEADSGSGIAGLRLSWSGWALLGWAVGAALFFCWFLVGKLVLWWMCSRSQPIHEGPWVSLLEEVARDSGITRPVRLFRSHVSTVAFTSGIRRPALILPAGAQGWSEESLRFVMLHELAHVKRRDTLIEAVAQLATILHWFNPLVWVAARRLRVERERACDDLVLTSGGKPSDYASQLMELAARLTAVRRPLWQMAAVSQGGSLKDRLLFILDPKRDRTTGYGPAALAVGLVMIALVLPLAAFTPWTPAGGTAEFPKGGIGEGVAKINIDGQMFKVGEIRRHGDLTVALHDSDSDVRRAAARTLGNIGDNAAMTALRSALASPNPEVRMTAMKELAAQGDPKSIKVFMKSLGSDDPKIRSHAAIDFLVILTHDRKETREAGLQQLRTGDGEKVILLLVRALGEHQRKAREWAAPKLVKAFHGESDDLRLMAVDALAQTNDPAYWEAFALALKIDSYPKVRYTAAKALGTLKPTEPAALKALIKTLKDEHPAIRAMAAWALGEIGEPGARKFLKKALGDTNEKVRNAAEEALSRIQ